MRPVPNLDLARVAQDYNDTHGLGYIRVEHWAEVDTDFGARTARAYEALPCTGGPEAAIAYSRFMVELLDQYDALVAAGYRMVPTRTDPYPDSAAMRAAARTRTLKVFEATDDAHRFLPAEVNTIFRWVHDLFGHAAGGFSFGPRGEFNAALHHAMMFSPLARRALLTETHGQNSWVNYGPLGSHNRAHPAETVYAPQKGALLPDAIVGEFESWVTAQTGEA